MLTPSLLMADSFLVDASGAKPGRYVLVVSVSSDGSVAVERVQTVVVLSNPSAPPTDGGDVSDPPGDSLVAKFKAAADAVIGDSDREETASNYGIVFGFVRDQADEGTITSHANLNKLTTLSLEQVAATNGVSNQWQPFIDTVKEEIADRGVMTTVEWSAFLTKAQTAMEISAGTSGAAFGDGRLLKLIGQLFKNEDLREILLPLLLKLLAGL